MAAVAKAVVAVVGVVVLLVLAPRAVREVVVVPAQVCSVVALARASAHRAHNWAMESMLACRGLRIFESFLAYRIIFCHGATAEVE